MVFDIRDGDENETNRPLRSGRLVLFLVFNSAFDRQALIYTMKNKLLSSSIEYDVHFSK